MNVFKLKIHLPTPKGKYANVGTFEKFSGRNLSGINLPASSPQYLGSL